MPSKRRSRGPRVGKRETIWCSSIITTQQITEAVQTIPLVEPEEWLRGSLPSYQKGATLLAIRGWIYCQRGITSAVTTNGALYMSIVKMDLEEPVSNPAAVTEYQEEDILWCGGYQTIFDVVPMIDSGHYFDLNVRAKRKLEASHVINLEMASNLSTVDFRVSGLVRALVMLP